MLSKRLAWLTTVQGRKFMKFVTVGTAGTVFCIELLPQTFFINYYRDFVGLRRHGKPFPVTAELKSIVDQVLVDLKLRKFYNKLVEPFMVYGYDVWHAGSLNSTNGTKIGLPIHYIYKKTEEIDKSGIIINNDFVNWNREEAQSLLGALIMSENAKKFSIAREVCLTDSYNIYIQTFFNVFWISLTYIIASTINRRIGLYDKPRRVRFLMYSFVGVFMWGLGTTQKDVMTKYYEHKADKKVSELGIDYAKGGLEFYDKIIKRNIALRELGGANGAKTFTKGGNETILFREKHVPNTNRRQFFEKKLKECYNTL